MSIENLKLNFHKPTRLNKEILVKANEVLKKNPERFQSLSHLTRCALMSFCNNELKRFSPKTPLSKK